jgi:hypothetical protein
VSYSEHRNAPHRPGGVVAQEMMQHDWGVWGWKGGGTHGAVTPVDAETNRIQLVLFGIQNRKFIPYSAAIHSPVMGIRAARLPTPSSRITETNRIHLVLCGMQHRTICPYLAAFNRILISVM